MKAARIPSLELELLGAKTGCEVGTEGRESGLQNHMHERGGSFLALSKVGEGSSGGRSGSDVSLRLSQEDTLRLQSIHHRNPQVAWSCQQTFVQQCSAHSPHRPSTGSAPRPRGEPRRGLPHPQSSCRGAVWSRMGNRGEGLAGCPACIHLSLPHHSEVLMVQVNFHDLRVHLWSCGQDEALN